MATNKISKKEQLKTVYVFIISTIIIAIIYYIPVKDYLKNKNNSFWLGSSESYVKINLGHPFKNKGTYQVKIPTNNVNHSFFIEAKNLVDLAYGLESSYILKQPYYSVKIDEEKIIRLNSPVVERKQNKKSKSIKSAQFDHLKVNNKKNIFSNWKGNNGKRKLRYR